MVWVSNPIFGDFGYATQTQTQIILGVNVWAQLFNLNLPETHFLQQFNMYRKFIRKNIKIIHFFVALKNTFKRIFFRALRNFISPYFFVLFLFVFAWFIEITNKQTNKKITKTTACKLRSYSAFLFCFLSCN